MATTRAAAASGAAPAKATHRKRASPPPATAPAKATGKRKRAAPATPAAAPAKTTRKRASPPPAPAPAKPTGKKRRTASAPPAEERRLATFNFDSDSEDEDDADRPPRRDVKVVSDPTAKKIEAITVSIMKATGNKPYSGISMMDTWSSMPMMTLFAREMTATRKLLAAAKYPEAMGSLLALYMNMDRYDNWFCDTEDVDEVSSTFTAFYKLAQDILAHDDATLCLTGRPILLDEFRRFGEKATSLGCDYEFPWFD
ncbi:hypothetical protein SDRG_00100 [Saprolegnia diclina VS20]|uniref:Uncharacterized protein n=1 Tax=Saprolegnia diclina (strain VS20) TaxID=1156394 RepID=T0SH90_SAPDV|nr:hypothetical protein SDRG_00100 [Saprolegnia diclina VS20]EQC42362.1 hypothetical protein SDRG_00100 [Saprolegnia diclina VS20]|eukprot:XP_008603785.1 hypothetical protein SDRG_00100 [Saprolegnia diclina VS20]